MEDERKALEKQKSSERSIKDDLKQSEIEADALADIADVEDTEATDPDDRINFIYMYLNRAFKFRGERWVKIMTTDETRKPIMNFLNVANEMKLIVTAPSPGYIVPSNDYPTTTLKTKAVYFIKKIPAVISPDNMYDVIIFGDFSPKPVDELVTLLEEIIAKGLNKEKYSDQWETPLIDEIHKRINEMKDTIYKVKAEMVKEPRLIMPPELDTVYDEHLKLQQCETKVIDSNLKMIYEKAVLMWANDLNEGILSRSSFNIVTKTTPYPIPTAEFVFWESRVQNLEKLYEQLRDPRVKLMASILDEIQSLFLPYFRETVQKVIEALNEARDREKYLYALKKPVDKLQSTPFEEAESLFFPLICTLGLVWVHCPGFNKSNQQLFHIASLICNLIIQEGNRATDPTGIFQGDVDDNLPKINKVIKNMKTFRKMFVNFDKELLKLFPEDTKPVLWLYDEDKLFERFDKNLMRLEELQFVLDQWSEYNKLEKLSVGGYYSENLTNRLDQITADFEGMLTTFRNAQYDPGDIDDNSWNVDYQAFLKTLESLDNKIAAVASLNFDDCTTLEETFKMLYLFQPFLEKHYVKAALEPKYIRIADMFRNEVICSYKIYNEQMTKYKQTGTFDVPSNWPPVAGSLLWLRNLRRRISYPLENIMAHNYEFCDTDDGNLLKRKTVELQETIEALELDIFDRWSLQVASEINWNLRKSVLNCSNAKILSINFDKKLVAAMREVRYLKYIDILNVPPEAADLYARSDELTEWETTLHKTVTWYNAMRQKTMPQEFDIIQDEIEAIDQIAAVLISTNNWNSPDNSQVITKFRDYVWKVADRVFKAQDNLQKIILLINKWNFKPLFNRPPGKHNHLLVHSDIAAINRRYDDIIRAGQEIYDLLEDNFRLLHDLPLIERTSQRKAEFSEEDEGDIGAVINEFSGLSDDDDRSSLNLSPKTIPRPTELTSASHASMAKTESSTMELDEEKPKPTESLISEQKSTQSKLASTSQLSGIDEVFGEDRTVETEDFLDPIQLVEGFDLGENEGEMGIEHQSVDLYIMEAPEAEVLQVQRPYQRAYFLSDLWKSEREGAPRPKYEDYVGFMNKPDDLAKGRAKGGRKGKKKGRARKGRAARKVKKEGTAKEKKPAAVDKVKTEVEGVSDFQAEITADQLIIDDDLDALQAEEEEDQEAEETPTELYMKLMAEFAKNPSKINRWDRYLDMVDDIVEEGLVHVVGAS